MNRPLILLFVLCISFFTWQACHKKNGPSPNQLSEKCAYRFIEPLDSCYITLPVAFTPNGDGLNDIYRFLRCNCSSVSAWADSFSNEFSNFHEAIYETNGSLVNENINLVNGWDGRDSLGNTLPAAKYYVTIQYTTNLGISVDTGTYIFLLGTDTINHCIINNTDSNTLTFGDFFDPATCGFLYVTGEKICN